MLDPHIWMSAQTGLNRKHVSKNRLHFLDLGSHTWRENKILNEIMKQNAETKTKQNTEEENTETKN